VVEELLPAMITFVAEMNMNQGISPRPFRFSDEGHTGLLRSFAAFSDITGGAGTNNVIPI